MQSLGGLNTGSQPPIPLAPSQSLSRPLDLFLLLPGGIPVTYWAPSCLLGSDGRSHSAAPVSRAACTGWGGGIRGRDSPLPSSPALGCNSFAAVWVLPCLFPCVYGQPSPPILGNGRVRDRKRKSGTGREEENPSHRADLGQQLGSKAGGGEIQRV